MGSSTYGYVRVSTKEQNEARQLIAMREFGVDNEKIIIEKLSGKDFNRPQYKKLLRKMKAGDTLVIKSIDRLGRNYSSFWATKKRVCLILRSGDETNPLSFYLFR